MKTAELVDAVPATSRTLMIEYGSVLITYLARKYARAGRIDNYFPDQVAHHIKAKRRQHRERLSAV